MKTPLSEELKHTPGPWTATHSCVIDPSGEIVACCTTGSVRRGDDTEDYATAHLIAAAPDLLAALVEADKSLEEANYSPNGYIRTKIRAAVTKASGVTPTQLIGVQYYNEAIQKHIGKQP